MKLKKVLYLFLGMSMLSPTNSLYAQINPIIECSSTNTDADKPAGGSAVDKSSDTELQNMIARVMPKFKQSSYTDSETNLTVPYNIFIPEDYDQEKSYPLVVFIGDMSTVGKNLDNALEQGWGGLVWATQENQEEHECIVVVPVYPKVIIDDRDGYVVTDYVTLTPRLIENITSQYSIDTNRIYGTGQSMGAMATLYLAANNLDLYAAVIIVDGQWETSQIEGIKTQTMIYFAAAGDQKAYEGQQALESMLKEKDVPFASISDLDAQDKLSKLNRIVGRMLRKGNKLNFVTWEAGTVLNGKSGSEHMASFDYAYKLFSVRNWLFKQSR